MLTFLHRRKLILMLMCCSVAFLICHFDAAARRVMAAQQRPCLVTYRKVRTKE